MQKEFKLINCGDLDIAASCEAQYGEQEKTGKEVYYPASFLIYVEEGVLDIHYENKIYTYPKGSFCFVRKYSKVYFSQTFSKEGRFAKSYTFIMPDVFLRKITVNYKFDKNLTPIGERILELEPTERLNTIIQTIKYAVDNEKDFNTVQLEVNVEEALKAVINSNPKLAILFKEFSLAQRADLTLFMNANYMLKAPLEDLAVMSGRSLSTFTREFKLIFNTTPHKWILKKRLQLAYKILIETHQSISDVYLEAGFEDLAHFSKTFKKEYDKTPSEIKQLGVKPARALSLV